MHGNKKEIKKNMIAKKIDVSNIHNKIYSNVIKTLLEESKTLSVDEIDWIETAIKQRLNRALTQRY